MELEFIKRSPEGDVISAWAVTPTGDWTRDCEKGANYACDLGEHMAETKDYPLFSRVIRDMAADRSGIAAGFLMQIGQFAAEAA